MWYNGLAEVPIKYWINIGINVKINKIQIDAKFFLFSEVFIDNNIPIGNKNIKNGTDIIPKA